MNVCRRTDTDFIKLAGISREVLDLKYEGAPPISIVAPKFKEKPKLPFKPRPWEETPFRNSARKDGLVLRHWRRKGDVGSIGAAMPVTPADSNAASEMEADDKATTTIPDSYWAKYNVKVQRPKYTDEQYETHLKSEVWSREETDYLVDLAYEFDLRWIIIADRYEYKPKEAPKETEDSMAVTPQAKPRTQEDMKARYYDVAAKTMVLLHPLSSMSSSEFDAHEKMTKYDPVRETTRKKYADLLMQRTEEEKYEEEMLLKELSRIVSNQEKLFNERKALYDRLEPVQNTSRENFSMSVYQSSQGLTQLMQQLFQQTKSREADKKKERRSTFEAGDLSGGGPDRNYRHSISGPDKRTSTGGESGRRQLSAREEAKWGVSHPNERMAGGVQFRQERVVKAGQAKSGVQTSRIGAALVELKVPTRLIMPTAKVVAEYENLIEKIKILLDVRKVSEKLDGEIKVWKQQKQQREAKDRGEEVEEVKEEEQGSPKGGLDEEEDEEGDSKVEVGNQNDESKVEEDANDEEDEEEAAVEEEDDEEEEDEEEGNKNDSDVEAENQDEEEEASNNDSEDDDEDGDEEAEAEENNIANEARELQEDEEGEEQEQEQDAGDDDAENADEDEAMADGASSVAPSPAPTTKSESFRKRSASIASHVSNRSSKRQRKQ